LRNIAESAGSNSPDQSQSDSETIEQTQSAIPTNFFKVGQ